MDTLNAQGIADALRRVMDDLLTIKDSRERLEHDGWIRHHRVRCFKCGVLGLQVLTAWTGTPFVRPLRTDGQRVDIHTLFETMECFCTNTACGYDAYASLCRCDATRDRTLTGKRPHLRTDGLCIDCLEPAVHGVYRNGNCTCGRCTACGSIVLPPSLQRFPKNALDAFQRLQEVLEDRRRALEGLKLKSALLHGKRTRVC